MVMGSVGGGRILYRRNKSLKGIVLGLGLIALILSGQPASVAADDIDAVLPYVVDNHDRVRAAEARLTAARNRAREALGDWFPTLGQTANAGHERQQNDGGDDTSTGFNEYDISLTQLLWDFGSTNASIDKARLQVEEARYSLIETKQALILEAITAYMNLVRANATLTFAVDSEENIRTQTGLEEALVDLGSGFSTDVLQAKTQLAGAQARRAQSEGSLTNALNRYKAVFGRMPDDLAALKDVPYPAAYLPTSLTQSVDIALETNPALKNAILAADIATEDVRIAKADSFFPRIEASGERKFKKNVGGTIGSEQETLAKVEMTLDFNLGFTAINTLRASKSDLSASTFTAADTRRNIEEQVRNAWQQLDTARRTAAHLNNQANIAAAFLELARNERQLGRRSLIDVLSGETNLINAKSDALSAETDVVIAAYGLLAATGQLEYEVIKRSKGTKPPIFQEEQTPAALLPSNDPLGSSVDNNNRSSKELMAMLRKTVSSMPVIKTAERPIDARPGSLQKNSPPKTVDAFPASNPKASPREDTKTSPARSVWMDVPAEQSNYGPENRSDTPDAQIASIEDTQLINGGLAEHVPTEGDTSVSSTPDELVKADDVATTAEQIGAEIRADINEVAALPDVTATDSSSTEPDVTTIDNKAIVPDETPSEFANPFAAFLSLFEGTKTSNEDIFEAEEDFASIDWSAPTRVRSVSSPSTDPAPTNEAQTQPNFIEALLSFFNSFSGETTTSKVSEANDQDVGQTAITSADKDKEEPGTLTKSESLSEEIEFQESAKPEKQPENALLQFISSLFSLDNIAETIKYSELETDPMEEFGR